MSVVSGAVSGDNTTAHVVTVSVLGQAMTQITMWLLMVNHIQTPDDATQAAIGVVISVIASWALQKMA